MRVLTSRTFAETPPYRLIDFGDGRKLEALGDYLVDRPSPAAIHATRARSNEWSAADARYDEASRQWAFRRPWPESLLLDCGGFRMPVRPTPYGHIGLFPEQFDNWRWLASRPAAPDDEALNLFAYTGASTMALVTAGYRVAHVDAAKPNVSAAGDAARQNGWTDPPVRYLVDDAAKFVARERRRGRTYHTVVLDPPAYGHGPQGRTWRIERDVWPLLDDLLSLLPQDNFRLLVTGHSPQVDSTDIVEYLRQHQRLRRIFSRMHVTARRSQLTDASGRVLDTGFVVRTQYTSPGQTCRPQSNPPS